MLKKLRRKFIRTAMLSVFFVLAIIIGAINILNYKDIVSKADATLAILKENDGHFPEKKAPPENKTSNEAQKDKQPLSPELPYESRYFSVVLYTASDAVISVDTGKIAAIDTETAIELAQNAAKDASDWGFMGNYRYTRHTQDNNTRIIFLDCTRDLSTFKTFLFVSCGISVIGLLAVLGLIIIFSKRMMRPVAESYEKQKQFITDAGHEIKTPLAIITADADVLEMDIGENEWIDDIRRQTNRLSSLTADLIMLSRMEEDKSLFMMIDFPLSEIVSEAAAGFAGPAKAGNKTLNTHIEPMLTLKGDEKAIRQLVSLLLDNALKYSPDGGMINMTLSRQAKALCLTIENETDTLPKKDIQKLSERFYRGDKSRNSDTKGFGLGLSIAKAIVCAHGGQLNLSIRDENVFIAKISLPSA